MQLTPPIILIAIGGLALVTQRYRWLVLGALLVQWAGMALQVAQIAGGTAATPVEIVTGLGCCAIFGLTIWSLSRTRKGLSAPSPRYEITDQLWLWASAVVIGVAGYALAQLYPLGRSAQDLLPFYSMLLPAILALVIDGPRDPVKLGAGVLSLFNSGLLLVYTFSTASPGAALFGLAALGRLVLAAILGYAWLFFKANYGNLDLNTLFDLRDGRVATETALAIVPGQAIEQAAVVGTGGTEDGSSDIGTPGTLTEEVSPGADGVDSSEEHSTHAG